MKTRIAPLIALPPRSDVALPAGTVALLAAGCSPRNGTTGVATLPTLRVCVLDPDAGDAGDWDWNEAWLDDVEVDSSSGSPARIQEVVSCGRSYLLVTPFNAFKPSSVHTLRCIYSNSTTGDELVYETTFTVTSGTTYTGTTPNSFERSLLLPCTQLLEVEPLRNILLDLALEESTYGGAQDRARAARVLYQIAQGSDASSLLNPYGTYDAVAHASDVVGRRTRFDILRSLDPYKRRVDRALASMVEGGPVPPALAVALVDGCDSALYTHKLATICVIPFLARAIEDASASA